MTNFTELFEDCTSKGRKIKKEDYLENGLYPIIDQGQVQIAGYSDDEEGLFTEVPAIVFGDHTRIIKYIHEPFFLGADGVKVLRCKNNDANYKYLYYALKNAKIPNTGYNRHFKWLKETKIAYPDIIKQNQITLILDKISKIIDYRKQQLDDVDNLIKSRFVEMFGDPVSDSMKWGQKPLGEFLDSIKYGTSTPPQFSESGYAFIRATNIKAGKVVVNDMKYINQEEANKIEKCKLYGGEILIVRSGVNSGDTCVITDKYVGDYAGYDIILVFNKNMNPVFVNVLINTEYMNKVVKPLTRRAAQPHLNSEQVQGMPLLRVPIDLQDQFASFVQQVDKLKVEVQKSLDETQILFDSLMHQYFE